MGMRRLSQFLHAGNIILLATAVCAGVVFEILVLLSYMAWLAPYAAIPVDVGQTIVLQIVWAVFTGPMILIIISSAQKQLDSWRSKIFIDW
jgi:hypothetical protein